MNARFSNEPALPELAGSFSSGARTGLRLSRLSAALLRAWPALLPALLFLPVVLSPPLNHDVAAVLDFSQRWLTGGHLYTDLIDVNPPLIFVLTLFPTWLGAALRINPVTALQGCVLAWGLGCWCLALSVRDRRHEGRVERAFLDVLPGLFLLAAGYDFGQREHLMAMGAVPYLLCAARRAYGSGRPLVRRTAALTAAAMAAGGFALKPHFLAIPALVETAVVFGRMPRGARLFPGLLIALRVSMRDLVPWLMAAVWLAYLASFPLLFPQYVWFVVPLARKLYLSLGGVSVLATLLIPRMATVLGLLLPLLVLTARGRGAGAMLPPMLALAALGALASAVAQHKGWSYHILPIELFAGALAATLAARGLDGLGAARRHRSGYPVASVLSGLFALYLVSNGEAPWKELGYGGSDADRLARILHAPAAGKPVLVLSPGIYPIYPALTYVGAHQTLPAMDLWMLQGAYQECLPDGRRYREPSEMGRAEAFLYRTVAGDFARNPPAAVLVDKQPGIPWCGSEFDFIAYFTRNPLFARAWSHYRLTAEWDRYRVYTRKD